MKTAVARLKEARKKISEISAFDLPALSWRPVGPGPDAKVVLETTASLGTGSFRFVAFRVQLPIDAGWSEDGGWNDARATQASFLLWDVPSYRRFVAECDALPIGCDPELVDEARQHSEVNMTPEMEELEAAWGGLCDWLSQDGDDWIPAMIDGAPYLIVGHSVGDAETAGPALEEGRVRIYPGSPDGYRTYPGTVCGMLSIMETVEVRHMRVDGRDVFRPVSGDAAAAEILRRMTAVLDLLPAGPRGTFLSGSRRRAALLLPCDAGKFEFDPTAYMQAFGADALPGTGRFEIVRPLGPVEADEAAVIEGLAAAVRERRLARRGEALFFVSHLDTLASDLRIDRRRGKKAVIRVLTDTIGYVAVRGAYKSEDGGATALVVDNVVKLSYVSDKAVYVQLSLLFAHLAENVADGVLARAAGGRRVEAAIPEQRLVEGPACLPHLPHMADGLLVEALKERFGPIGDE